MIDFYLNHNWELCFATEINSYIL